MSLKFQKIKSISIAGKETWYEMNLWQQQYEIQNKVQSQVNLGKLLKTNNAYTFINNMVIIHPNHLHIKNCRYRICVASIIFPNSTFFKIFNILSFRCTLLLKRSFTNYPSCWRIYKHQFLAMSDIRSVKILTSTVLAIKLYNMVINYQPSLRDLSKNLRKALVIY